MKYRGIAFTDGTRALIGDQHPDFAPLRLQEIISIGPAEILTLRFADPEGCLIKPTCLLVQPHAVKWLMYEEPNNDEPGHPVDFAKMKRANHARERVRATAKEFVPALIKALPIPCQEPPYKENSRSWSRTVATLATQLALDLDDSYNEVTKKGEPRGG